MQHGCQVITHYFRYKADVTQIYYNRKLHTDDPEISHEATCEYNQNSVWNEP